MSKMAFDNMSEVAPPSGEQALRAAIALRRRGLALRR